MSHRSSPALPPHTPVIVAGLRTPVGTAGHALAHVDVEEEEEMTPELRRSIDLALTQGFTSLDADSQETLAQYLLRQEEVSPPARPRNARRGYRIEQVASDDGPVKGLPAH